jgi:putative FmdB family regulatory protein
MINVMPIYEYRCEKDHVFEAMQSFSDEPLTECEVCGAPVRRVIYAPAIHFKGSGFYSTDYGKKGSTKAADSDGGKPTDSDGASKSESEKPAAAKAEKTEKTSTKAE